MLHGTGMFKVSQRAEDAIDLIDPTKRLLA
jgi:hypothetical protein